MDGLRRYLLVTVSAAALSTGALAADMPVKAPAPVVVPWSWTGFYVGAHAGVAWNRAAFADIGDDTGSIFAAPLGLDFWKPSHAGFMGGGQIGYNLQSGNMVYGVEADFSGVGGKQTAIVTVPASTLSAATD